MIYNFLDFDILMWLFGFMFSVKLEYYLPLIHVDLLPLASMPSDEELATNSI